MRVTVDRYRRRINVSASRCVILLISGHLLGDLASDGGPEYLGCGDLAARSRFLRGGPVHTPSPRGWAGPPLPRNSTNWPPARLSGLLDCLSAACREHADQDVLRSVIGWFREVTIPTRDGLVNPRNIGGFLAD